MLMSHFLSICDNLPIHLIRQCHGCNRERQIYRTSYLSSPVDYQENLSCLCPLAPLQFINLISGSNFGVGNGLRSFTNTVEPTHTFHLDDRRVILIDTPGFDDTSLSDTDVLNLVASFLANS